jgi:hypothetical protein
MFGGKSKTARCGWDVLEDGRFYDDVTEKAVCGCLEIGPLVADPVELETLSVHSDRFVRNRASRVNPIEMKQQRPTKAIEKGVRSRIKLARSRLSRSAAP